MIQVKIDEEIFQVFRYKLRKGRAKIGDAVHFDSEYFCWVTVIGNSIFPSYGEVGEEDEDFYDREFTEWLKENRPEVFI